MRLKNILKINTAILLLTVSFNATPADYGSMNTALKQLVTQALSFNERMPREKVYVHIDNTGYFKGDKIWFQCYVVDGINNAPTSLSHTLYVELLNPRGKVIDKQILRIKNGRCHGVFNLNHLPFYSGFYEIRAYTKYMLNFGDAALFSRVIPVFESPKNDGDFSERKMERGLSKYPGKRPRTKAVKNVSMMFYPEGGSLIAGIPARVAFEITGRGGIPIEATGRVIDKSTGHTVAEIRTIHEGRGFFEMTPELSEEYSAVITCGNDKREYKFTLPQVRKNGVGLSVDNISVTDSILIKIHPDRETDFPDIAGVAVSSRGALWAYVFFYLNDERTLRLSSREMPSGVSIITLFGPDGQTLAERMIFINNGGFGRVETILTSRDKPLDKVTLDLSAADADGNPAAMLPLSVSVTDADNAVDYHGSILSELLLMSEIKGYIRNPMQYFRNVSDSTARNLDLLMMVSGWRCYSWEEMADIKPIELRYPPEQAIDLDGQVISFGRGIPKADVDVSVMMSQTDVPDSLRQDFTGLVSTDSCGHFNLSYDLNGKWSLLMSVSESGKKKNHRIILNRLFSPNPRKYDPAEILLDIYAIDEADGTVTMDSVDSINDNETSERVLDSLAIRSIKLDEMMVKGKLTSETDKYNARSKSVAYYDMQEELGDLTDKGEITGTDVFDILKAINPNFQSRYTGNRETIMYKSKEPLFVINYQTTYAQDSLNYTYLYPEAIKSVFITEDPSTMMKYADPSIYSALTIDDKYSCAVLIETIPGQKGPVGRGTRMQTIQGYTIPEEYQNIEDVSLLDDPDFRRTLYWNPLLTTGPDGKAHIEFFNNSTCRNLHISIHGIDENGTIYSN